MHEIIITLVLYAISLMFVLILAEDKAFKIALRINMFLIFVVICNLARYLICIQH
jgi:uncharacterized membrane protein YccC